MMLARIVGAIVDAQHERDVFIGRWCGDDGFLGAGIQMSTNLRPVGENSGGFNDDVDAELFPRQAGGFFLIEHGDRLAVDLHDAVTAFDFTGVNAVGRVVAKQVGVGFQIRHVVDRDDGQFILTALEQGAQHQPANPAKSIDCDFGCHRCSC